MSERKSKRKGAQGARGMTKAEIISHIASKTGRTQVEVSGVLDEFIALTIAGLNRDGEFTFSGLAKFTVKQKKPTPARTGRNPRTGEPVQIAPKPARKAVGVRAAKAIKDAVV